MIGCLRTHVRKQPINELYFESELVLKFYNLEAWLFFRCSPVLVAKQRKLKFCCLVYHLVNGVSSLCLSVFVTSDQRMLWFTYTFVLFACVDDLRPNRQLVILG